MTRGVYQIRNVRTEKCYIGSSVNIEGRWVQHRFDLERRQHANSYLQRAWEKDGPTSFIFEVVEEVVDRVDLEELETSWIQRFWGSGKLYNSNPFGGRSGVRSEETREKLRQAKLGRGNSEESKEKNRQANLRRSPELLKLIGERASKARWTEGGRRHHSEVMKRNWASRSQEQREQQKQKTQSTWERKRREKSV